MTDIPPESVSRKSGMSTFVVILLVFVSSFSIMLSASDPGRAWITSQIRKFRFWNSASIEKNPQLFAEWCETETIQLKHVLNARRLELLSEKSQLRRERDSAIRTKNAGVDLLALAKKSYRMTNATKQWPVKFQGMELTEVELKSRILELDQECRTSQNVADCMNGLLPEVETQLRHVSLLLSELKQVHARAMIASTTTGKPATRERLSYIRDQLDALGAMGVTGGASSTLAPAGDVLISRYDARKSDDQRFEEILME